MKTKSMYINNQVTTLTINYPNYNSINNKLSYSINSTIIKDCNNATIISNDVSHQ